MNFHWIQISDEILELWGYEQKIAALGWSRNNQRWELESEYLEYSSDLEGFDKEQINQVEAAAVETLIEYCKEQMDYYQGKIEELEEVPQC